MRFLLDQNLSPKTTAFLKSLGIEACDVREFGLAGATDERIYAFAQERGFAVITCNTGFAALFRGRGGLPALLLIRVSPQTFENLHPVLQDFFQRVRLGDLQGHLIIIGQNRYRLRKVW
ncbi:MAG: DUF5615 family PIN-like protein [Dehalococcoidia bacterium]|nr:DUF5615 family PIN-like protein [Dehalococcoidia bacterium]MDW8120307.1 DUF5615 family PIN-like protein [Chloroflexota bacterium]